jgi:hypothetical protein
MTYNAIPQVVLMGLSLVAAAGCWRGESDGGGEALGTSESAITSFNRLTMNNLTASSLGVAELSSAALSGNGLTLAQDSLLKSKKGREVLTFLMRCALPAGGKVSGSLGGKTYTFSGLIGLAPEWLGTPLSKSERRWVSACMLAHVNGYDNEVAISLRGSNPALATSAAEMDEYAVEEMSFYGDVFDPDGPTMYACAGDGPQTTCPGPPGEQMARRSCDEDEPCLMQVPGPCHDMTLSGADACEGGSSGLSSGCHSTLKPSGNAWPAGNSSYLEVITVYMSPGDFEDYFDCDYIGLLESTP